MDLIDLVIWVVFLCLAAWFVWWAVNAIMTDAKVPDVPRRIVRVGMLIIAVIFVVMLLFGRVTLPRIGIIHGMLEAAPTYFALAADRAAAVVIRFLA